MPIGLTVILKYGLIFYAIHGCEKKQVNITRANLISEEISLAVYLNIIASIFIINASFFSKGNC